MSLITPAIKGFLKLRANAIDNFMLNPIDTQKQVFNHIIGSGQFTEYGKKYNFHKINSVAEYKKNVPVVDYDDIKPYIERTLKGEQNLLWPSPINWFAKSSGTTSDKSKFIPISKESLDDNHFKAGKDIFTLYLMQHPQSDFVSGKCLAISGSHQINQLNADSFYGDLSAVMLQNLPLYGHMSRTPELAIALLSEWEEKIEKIAKSTINEDVTYIVGVPTWTMVLLKRILEISGASNISEVWPNLEVYVHGGVSFKPYRAQFEQLIPSTKMQYLETYNASEGFFAVQDDVHRDDMLLFLNHGIYYEFMPMEEWGKEHPETLSLKEVELEKNYALVLNTNGGLWRYVVGDTIKFTSKAPFRIKVTGRLKHYINAFGEEVIVDNADNAIEEASKITGAKINDYTAAPVYMSENENGAHEWIIEFEHLPCSVEEFAYVLDAELQKINSDYEAKRQKNIALRMPIVHQMPKGGFNAWLKDKDKLGGQHKVPRLSNDRKYLEEIMPYTKR